MSEANVYGPIVTRRRVATWLRDHIGIGASGYFPGYLRDVQRIEGWADEEPDPTKWPEPFIASRFTFSEDTVINLVENDLPALILGSPGLSGAPMMHGEDRALEGAFVFGCHALVSGNDEDSTDRLMGEYTAALRALLAQQTMIGGGVASIQGIADEGYDALPQYASRTLAAGTVTVLVVVEELVHAVKGPMGIPDDPNLDPGPFATIETTSLTVDRLED